MSALDICKVCRRDQDDHALAYVDGVVKAGTYVSPNNFQICAEVQLLPRTFSIETFDDDFPCFWCGEKNNGNRELLRKARSQVTCVKCLEEIKRVINEYFHGED